MAGVTRAKAVPRDRFAAFVEIGMGASPSWLVFCADFGIAFTPDLGVTGDLRLRIDPEATTVIDHGVAWAPADFLEQDGEPFRGCPRWRLRTVRRAGPVAGLTARDRRRAGIRPRDARRVGAPARPVAGLRGAVDAGRRPRSWRT